MRHAAIWTPIGVFISLAVAAWLLWPRPSTAGTRSDPAIKPVPDAHSSSIDAPRREPLPIKPDDFVPVHSSGEDGDHDGSTVSPVAPIQVQWADFKKRDVLSRLADIPLHELNALSPECHAQLIEEFEEISGSALEAGRARARMFTAYTVKMIAAGRVELYPFPLPPEGQPAQRPQIEPEFPGQTIMTGCYVDKERNCGVLRVVRINPGDDEGLDHAVMVKEREWQLAGAKLRAIIDKYR